MKLLAIDTSSSACSVAINNNGSITAIHRICPKQQTQLILSVIQEALNSANLALSELDGIAYGCGPGSFTGIRIASSVVQGIAFTHNLPVYPISSLAAMAQAAYQDLGITHMLVGVDARVGQLYWAPYIIDESGYAVCQSSEEICDPHLVPMPAKTAWIGIGDGWAVYQDQLVARLGFCPVNIYTERLASASAILALVKHKLRQGMAGKAAHQALPVYFR